MFWGCNEKNSFFFCFRKCAPKNAPCLWKQDANYTYIRQLEDVQLNALCTFSLRPVSRGDNNDIWEKVFKNGPSEICGRQPLKNLKWYGLLKSILCIVDNMPKKLWTYWFVSGSAISEEGFQKLENILFPFAVSMDRTSQPMLKNNRDLTLIPDSKYFSTFEL